VDLTPLIDDGTLIPLGNEVVIPTSLSLHSQAIEKGGLFIAIPGSQHDGTAFIQDALHRGAVGVVAPLELSEKVLTSFKVQYPAVAFFSAPNIRKAASVIASHFYPLQPDSIVAVTGTNGKTSVVSFLRQIWHHLGFSAASLGTLGLIVEGKPLPPAIGTDGINTPNPVRLHQILQSLREQQINHLAFEASSHGLHQHRLDSVRLKAAIFTNFSNDHLDYHHTLDDYFEAKSRLFREVMVQGSYAILNTDIVEYEKLLVICKKRGLKTITFGKTGDMIRLVSVVPKEGFQDVVLRIQEKSYGFTLPLVGQFQVYNVMAALGAVIACEGDIAHAIEVCANLKGVPGRLEQAAPGIYVDYSHKPDALSEALKALRHHTSGKLWQS